jgi:hypothetical protein
LDAIAILRQNRASELLSEQQLGITSPVFDEEVEQLAKTTSVLPKTKASFFIFLFLRF